MKSDNKTNEDIIEVKETKKNKPKVDDLIEELIETSLSKKKVTKNKVKIISNEIDV